MYLDRVGAVSDPVPYTWEPRDCSLYALAVGAGLHEPAFTTEGQTGVPQKVYPSFAFTVAAALAGDWPDPCFATGDFPLEKVVLGEQGLRVHRALEPAGAVTVRVRVAGIYDKGSAALVELEQEAFDETDGTPVFTASVGLFVMGEGGFGGERGAASAASGPVPERAPDARVEQATLPIQTLLYRHGGNDDNPVHLDAEFAARAGWDGPILTGQNTLGFACHALVDAVADGEPGGLRSLRGRFAQPAYNGDLLTTELWLGDDVGVDDHGHTLVRFRVRNQHDAVVVDRGSATFA